MVVAMAFNNRTRDVEVTDDEKNPELEAATPESGGSRLREQTRGINPEVERRVLRKIDLFLMPAMVIGEWQIPKSSYLTS